MITQEHREGDAMNPKQKPMTGRSAGPQPIETQNSAPQSAESPTIDRVYFIKLGLQMAGAFAVGALLLILLGVAQKMGWLGTASAEASSQTGANDVIYTCPMDPQVRQPEPGDCFICDMPLVPATSASGSSDTNPLSIEIEPAARRLANIQTAPVERKTVFHTIETIGSIQIDESRMATISAYVSGRIERMFADYTGVEVRQGEHLTVLYSPSLYSAQVEYLQSRRTLGQLGPKTLPVVRQTQEQLAANSRKKLVELGMTEEQIAELEASNQPKSRLTLYAPIGGTVTDKLAVEGQYIKEGQPIYQIANLSTVWIMLELYPEDASRVRFGQHVEAELQSLPGQVFNGRVGFIDPTVDPKTRTVGVRVEVINADGRLRPGDYASARIRVPVSAEGQVYDAHLAGKWISPMHPQIIRDEPGECPICGMDLVPASLYGYSEVPVEQSPVLVVPRDAVLMAGGNSVVYVKTEPNRFEIRPVILGPITRETVQTEDGQMQTRSIAVVLGNLEEGESVATAGNFLIDSQMQLAGKPSLIDSHRVAAIKAQEKGPLRIDSSHVERVSGEVGTQLERLYQAYFEIQSALAADKKPGGSPVETLRQTGEALRESEEFPTDLRPLVEEIVEHMADWDQLELEQARKQFEPISQSVIQMAAQVRGAQAHEAFIQFYCPMVQGGRGDWLQAGGKLANPYFGSQMLRCGDEVRELPTSGPIGGSDP